ncbi:MAG: glucokinase [Candidatus Marinimicrobia bacterium CG08_land_8_20_14_0_20_45_22]|nr:MAG: glucokinase [Candidatus Marinimicrobia bacterium CG08_land_8_20_14_0_20_45_22]
MSGIKIVVGVDIGGTNTGFGLVEPSGKILAKGAMPTHAEQPAEDFFRRLFEEIDLLFRENPERFEVCGVGIGAPNANYYTGRIENPPNLSWKVVDVVAIVKKYLDVPVALTNDANAAALGEMQFGNARGMKNFVEITLGTGLGSGIIVNGELVYGHDGFAGEMGHLMIERDGRACGCGKRGCFEAYVSATGLARTAIELLVTETDKSSLRAIPTQQITSKSVYEAAISGDVIAQKAFEITGRLLGETLANTVEYLSPEAIFLFGGMAAAGDLIFKPAKEHMEKNLLPIFRNKVKILPSGLAENEAAILGAGALIWHELSKNV